MQFMMRNFTILEKSISTILILIGCILLFTSIFMIYTLIEIANNRTFVKPNYTFLTILKNYLLEIFASTSLIFGGIYMLRNNKFGWVSALIGSILNSFLFLKAIIEANTSHIETFFVIFIRILITILFFSITYCLLLRQFRTKYL